MTSFYKCRLDTNGNWGKLPQAFCDLLGYSQNELHKLSIEKTIHENDRKKTARFFSQIRQENNSESEWETETIFLSKSGESIPAQAFFSVVRDTKGSSKHVLAFINNLSKQQELKQKLKVSKQQFESIFHYNPLPVYYYDLEGNFQDCNEKLAEFTGLSREEIIGLNFDEFITGEDLERSKEYFQKAAGGEAGQYEIEVVVKDGIKKDIRVTKFPMYMGNEITGVYGIFEDITNRKKREEALQESEQRWQQLVEYNPQPVLIIQDEEIVFINEVGAEYFGAASTSILIGKPILDFNHNDSLKESEERLLRLQNNEKIGPAEHKIVLLNGETRYVNVHSIPITFKGKQAIQTVIHDISELKEKQHSIGKSLKEKEIMLQEIHHRVKNNLAVISGLLELQQMNISDEDTIIALKDSQQRIKSMAMIHEKLYQSESLHSIGFNIYLKELVDSIKSSYESSHKKISVNYKLDHVTLDLDQAIPSSLIINEVIVNCYKHAFDKDFEGEINITLTYKNPKITLEITDNGKGLPEDFDIAQQKSLGTTLINAFSNQLKGDMVLTNRKNGNGTKFRLQFEKFSKAASD